MKEEKEGENESRISPPYLTKAMLDTPEFLGWTGARENITIGHKLPNSDS